MISKLPNAFVLGAVALLLVACAAPRPIVNIDNAPVGASGTNYDLSDVTKAIKRAGIGLGWQMKEETPGHIVGTLRLRSHTAVVDVTYTLDEYSITYKDSANLKYDAGTNSIHSSYNRWIGNLRKQIDIQLVGL